jgi:hypothetical protein
MCSRFIREIKKCAESAMGGEVIDERGHSNADQ